MTKTSIVGEVGQEGSLREGLEVAIRERVREIIEMVLEEEVEAALGASRSQRVAERSGYRHGHKSRRLTLRTGTVQMNVPRARLVDADGGGREWQSQLVRRYRRSSPEVEQSVLGVYLSGTNTRRIRGALEPLLTGAALSKSAVSRLVTRLEESYRTWQQRDLAEEPMVYLYLDAIYPKVRSGGRVVSLPVLVALGVRENGEKTLLSLLTAGSESAAGWQMLLEDLAARHLRRPRLVISDGNPGLAAALDRLWPGMAHQRCTVHKLRNLVAKAPKHVHEAVREDYHRIVYAESLETARKAREAFLRKWEKQCAGVAASLEEAGEQLLTFFQFPESQWISLRTTNVIERMQLEFRRRVKTQAALPNEGRGTESVLRIVGQRADEAAPHSRLSGHPRHRKGCCIKRIPMTRIFPDPGGHATSGKSLSGLGIAKFCAMDRYPLYKTIFGAVRDLAGKLIMESISEKIRCSLFTFLQD